ncbi:MAG: RNA polymerase factor sigma-54 [Burkholderiales bacterium]
MSALDFRTETRHSQTLSPRLQRAVRLLQLSSLDFAAQVNAALGTNPFLEADEAGDDADADTEVTDTGALDLQPSDDSVALPVGAEAELTPIDVDDGGPQDDRDLWQADGSPNGPRNDDAEVSALDMTAVQASLNTHLHGQLNLLPLDERDLALAKAVVESLDDDGYLRIDLTELQAVVDLSPPASLEELQIALRRVQSLDPAGVGARSVGECILLQLPAIDCPQQRALAETIVVKHLDALATRDVTALARRLELPLAQVQQVCDRIRRLDPRPGWRFSSSHIAYVVPDVVVKKHRGQWHVQLNPAIVPRVRLNKVYAELFARHRTSQNGELANHLQEARWTVRNVEQRFSTILSVAEAIVKRQKHFLDFGAMAMKPLGLKEIAEEVGLHESTVSRVTTNKYMSTPSGVFELKYFFSRAMVSANGSACSGTAIRGLIKDMIAGEPPEASLSDAEITRQLAQQGLVVARRTVTKYRQLLRIEPVDRRRRHAA